jgi:hypothetical protein
MMMGWPNLCYYLETVMQTVVNRAKVRYSSLPGSQPPVTTHVPAVDVGSPILHEFCHVTTLQGIDAIITNIGEFGRFQKLTYAHLTSTWIPLAVSVRFSVRH